MMPLDLIIAIIAAFLSMCMFSTLYGKSSPFYALAEESYIGFGTGLTVVVNILYIYRTGILGIKAGNLVLILGIILGLMVLFRIHQKYSYIARLPIAIALGAQFALALRTTIFTGFLDQIRATIVPLLSGEAQTLLYRWTIALCIIFMLTFFFYTIELKGPLKWSSTIGEYLMYIAFGAIFAQTFMGRLGLFVGTMQYLATPIWKKPILVANMVIVLLVLIALDKTGLRERWTPEE